MNLILSAIAILLFGCFQNNAAEATTQPDTDTREFSKYKCRYTLPGPNWEWLEIKEPSVVFAARDDTGFVLILNAGTIAPNITMTKEFLAGVDKGVTKSNLVKKRSDSRFTFKGVPCYQLEMLLANEGKTAASRVFLANGFSYSLQLIGKDAPVERSPIFPIAMNKFEFTQKPTLHVAPTSDSPQKSDAEAMGEKAGQALFYIFLLGLIVYLTQKDKAKKPAS
jgi:hypothetical protein